VTDAAPVEICTVIEGTYQRGLRCALVQRHATSGGSRTLGAL
jgi:hypothetical protein